MSGRAHVGKQRAELSKVLDAGQPLPATYVVTSSVVVRGIGTAISWFLPPAKRPKMYALNELD